MGIDFFEVFCEGSWGGAVAWQGCGDPRAEETIIGSGEEESGTETGVGDVVAVGVWQARDRANPDRIRRQR